MLKKTLKWINPFTDEEEEDVFYFNLTKAELVELEMSTEGGLSESLKKIVASEDGGAIIREFKNIILISYGVRSEDGRFFKKTQGLRDEFESSEAYSALFMELVENADAAAEFVTSMVPVGMVEEASEVARETQTVARAEVVPLQLRADDPKPAQEIEPQSLKVPEDNEAGKGDN